MQQNYFLYVHEKDRYDFYMLHDVLRPASLYFMIDFEDATEFFLFLNAIRDGLYPQLVVIDLYDELQVQTIINKLNQLQQLPFVPVWILADVLPAVLPFQNSIWVQRPQHRDGWTTLAHRIIQHMAEV